MTQKVLRSWTNPDDLVVPIFEFVGFNPTVVEIFNYNGSASFIWNVHMGSELAFSFGTATNVNTGCTVYEPGALFSSPIVNITKGATTDVEPPSGFDASIFEVGQTVRVSDIAYSGTGALAGEFVITNIVLDSPSSQITLDWNTSSGYGTYVSGGLLTIVKDAEGKPVPTKNYSSYGVKMPIDLLGDTSTSGFAIISGAEPSLVGY